MASPSVRRRKKKSGPSLVRKYWWLVPVLACVGMIGWVATGPRWSRGLLRAPARQPITGYIAGASVMLQEYQHFYGKPLSNAEAELAFNQASQRVAAKDYSTAVGLLERVSRVAAVPIVFNNLGVLYAELNDKTRAITAFREALSRDTNYQTVRLNLERMRDIMAMGADPLTHELESNNSISVANLIAPDKPVDGEIEAAVGDEDYFRVTTPPAPRDLVSIEITNRSAKLAPVLKVFDAEGRITDWGKTGTAPGASLKQTIAPAPNVTLFIQVSGHDGSTGAYTVTVHPRKAFDTLEPNDDIFNAARISLGTPVSAGIMDSDDTDYFSFVSPRNGTVTIQINNRSTTLIPALSTFFPDKRSSGFGPDVRNPGQNLRHTLQVLENQVYYIQVWSQANTAGDYTLLVE